MSPNSNVPEHWLVGHPAIRQACAECDLAMLWRCPTFFINRQRIQATSVSVAAWQWGRTSEPAVQTAAMVERAFKIHPKN